MNTLEAIFSRRSVRNFKKKAIDKDTLYTLIKSGMQAPSAMNYQPWHFIITTDKAILREIVNFHPYAEMLLEASAAISVCGDLNIEKSEGYNAVNCSAATQNILLAAHELGLGAVWLGIYPRKKRIKELKRVLKIPEHILPISLIAVGYPAVSKSPINRYRESRVHFEVF